MPRSVEEAKGSPLFALLSNGTPEFSLEPAHFLQGLAAAREALDGRDQDLAARLCQDGLAEAERLFDAALAGASPLVAPMAYTVACKLLAEVSERAGDREAARTLKIRAVEKLLRTVESPRAPLSLRVNCMRHLRRALMYLVDEAAEHDSDERGPLNTLLRRCAAASSQLVRLTTYMMSEQVLPGAVAEPAARAPMLN